MNYKISSKVNGKWFTFGNVKQREKGLSMGLKKTPELMEMINATADGGYFNFLLFEQKPEPGYKPAVSQHGDSDYDNSPPF